MRPVLLQMHGFASFRAPTIVDFRDAEYFALVGPTGSGKSTVIDALTFALYGAVARWDDRRAVALALAPTVGRGTVRFVFDVSGARYVVARELRRAASGGVSVRSARLERLRDAAGTGGVDEETETIADGAGPTTRAVEELLGLPFGDFTTCVVLPQGEFAEFLHTEPRKRQEKLVRILGLGVYDVVAREANSEAAAQRQRAEVLTEQLDGYADATPEAAVVAAERVDELGALARRVRAAAAELAAAAAALTRARHLAEQLRGDADRLAALAAPSGLDGLAARHRAAGAVVGAAVERAEAAEAADLVARSALTSSPAREPLERARRGHTELAALVAEAPGAGERHEKARSGWESAEHDTGDARRVLDAARVAHAGAVTGSASAAGAAQRLGAETRALRDIHPPAGLDALALRREAGVAAAAAAAAALADAEAADAQARDALAAAPDRGPLEQARRDHLRLAAVAREHDAAGERLASAQAEAGEAVTALEAARAHLDDARAEQARRQRDDLAAALRPSLAVGEPCPVCAQAVAVLPEPVVGSGPDPADAAASAEEAHERGRRRESAAAVAVASAAEAASRSGAECERLETAVVAVGPVATVEGMLVSLDRLAREAERAAAAARGARRQHAASVTGADGVHNEFAAAAVALRSARDPLVPLGAPAVDDDVVAGWHGLLGWAAVEAAGREGALAAAWDAVTVAGAAQADAARDLADVERIDRARRTDETAAARAEQDARGAVDRITARTAELRAVLVDAPTDADAVAGLAVAAERESAAARADAELRAARAAQRSAERSAQDIGREIAAAWDALRTARDPLVPLGAPALTGDDLVAAWSALTGWAAREAERRTTALVAAEAEAQDAEDRRTATARRTTEDLAAHSVVVPAAPEEPGLGAEVPELGTAAAPAVAAALERARAAQEGIAERRATAAGLLTVRDEAAAAQQVAKMLGGLLRSDGFPRWLVASALDALVADASRSLAELSGGQFELTHDQGEFLVVDHADADARRPVKTLSGGETFQASLALALALSSQMSELAARGAARLESIFLDEGFGTLDEANLEVVASTLEGLATRGDRVVGVITHVPALAERVPVRFVVSRDQRTSSVERVE